jgi:hypothetical protein
VTAADGAVGFYTTANNDTRKESPEQAVKNDRRVQDAWGPHPRRQVVPNGAGGFAEKVDTATEHVLDMVEAGR